jgi:hypothetical protein
MGFLDGEKAPRFETRLVGVLVCRASGFVAVPAMDDLIDDIPLFLGTAAITGRRGERAFEAALARARAGEEADDGFEILGLTADAEVFSLFCFSRQNGNASEWCAKDTYLNSEAYYSLSSLAHINSLHLLVQFSEIENLQPIPHSEVDSCALG